MSRAVGVKKQQEPQKSKSFMGHESTQRQGEEFYDPAREENISKRIKTGLELLEEHLKDPIVALDKALESAWKVST